MNNKCVFYPHSLGNEPVPFILVGNKADLSHRRRVSYEDAQRLANYWQVPYVETSAKTRMNLDRIFYDIMRMIYMRKITESRIVNGARFKKTKKKKRCILI